MTTTDMCDEKEWFVAAPWGRIAVVAWGDCRSPPVLLCHGKLDSAGSFRPLVHLLPSKFYYIGFDLPGNGKSDWFPPGLPLSVFDLMYSLRVIVEHFRWRKFIFVGHSLGCLLGKLYNGVYPGRMERAVYLDPVPAYYTVEPEDISVWYYKFFTEYFSSAAYAKHNAPPDTAPGYTRDQALKIVQKNRGLTPEAAEHVIGRIIEPVGDGLYRFTFDQRMKKVTRPPYQAAQLERLDAAAALPVLTVLAEDSVARGSYEKTPFIFRPDRYPRGNHRALTVSGGHDVHLTHPERLAEAVGRFVAETEVKAKL